MKKKEILKDPQHNGIKSDSKVQKGFDVLNEDSYIDIGEIGKEVIQKAYDLGYLYEDKHRGCARCTIAALQDAIGFISHSDELFRAASCLDGGATPTKYASCGAFTGLGMIIGWLCGTERFGNNSFSSKLINKVYKCFEEEYGSVICREIREKTDQKCPEVVANAAKWTTEILLKEFTNYK
jgi:C_GCAxxG_C_C family probable redox protein